MNIDSFSPKQKRLISFIHSILVIIPYYFYDLKRFSRFAMLGGEPRNQLQYDALLTKDYHKIEKALSFNNFRYFSAQSAINEIIYTINNGLEKFDNHTVTRLAITTLEEYITRHKTDKKKDKFITTLEGKIDQINKKLNALEKSKIKGGTTNVSKKEILRSSMIDLDKFFKSRYSIRNFSPEEVSKESIEKAIDMALKTPSVCNRQGWKVYIVENEDLKQKALNIQGGNRGFGDTVNKLLVITTEINTFNDPKERNQYWIDGGLFSMSIVYALHSMGIGTCCLNWSAKPAKDKKLRKALNIKPNHAIVMLLAIGHYKDEFKVCVSHRKNTKEIIHYLN